MRESRKQRRPPVAWVVWIVGVAMTWPALAVALVWKRLRWRNPWVSLSVLINLLFFVALAIAILDERSLSQREEDSLPAVLWPDCVECRPESLKLCRPRVGSEMARIEPDAIYVVQDGVARVRIAYETADHGSISDISIYDESGRRWTIVDFKDNTLMFEHYSDDLVGNPDFSLIDRDLDGVPDEKVDWNSAKGFERVGELNWQLLVSEDQ